MSDLGFRVVRDADELRAIWTQASRVINPAVRLPNLPFVAATGTVTVGQFGRLLGDDFVPVLQSLAREHGDGDVTTTVIDPTSAYYDENYGFLPAFTMDAHRLDEAYWEGLSYSPSGDPTGEIGVSADVVAVVGSSGKWAVWGQRSWDIALVWAVAAGSWLDAGVPFVTPRAALEDFAGYGTWGTRLDPHEVDAFVRNVEAFG
jgi:hypothetical protein